MSVDFCLTFGLCQSLLLWGLFIIEVVKNKQSKIVKRFYEFIFNKKYPLITNLALENIERIKLI